MKQLACLALLLCLLTACGPKPSSTSIPPPEAATSAPAASVPLPQAPTAAETIPPAAYRWLQEPFLEYDKLYAVQDLTGGEASLHYLTTQTGGRSGGIEFESGREVFPLEDLYPLLVCDMGGLHSYVSELLYPPYVEENAAKELYAAAGLPFEPCAAHGLGGYDTLFGALGENGAITVYLQYMGGGEPFDPANSSPYLRAGDIVQYAETTMDEYGGVTGAVTQVGFCDWYGNPLTPIEYEYGVFDPGVGEGLCLVAQNGRLGFISAADAAPVIPCEYEPLYPEYEAENAFGGIGLYGAEYGFFNEGLCPVRKNGRCGYIDASGNQVVPFEFEGATHVLNGTAWVQQNGLWGQIEILTP